MRLSDIVVGREYAVSLTAERVFVDVDTWVEQLGLDIPAEDENGHVSDDDWEAFERQCTSLARGFDAAGAFLGFASLGPSAHPAHRRSRSRDIVQFLLGRTEPLVKPQGHVRLDPLLTRGRGAESPYRATVTGIENGLVSVAMVATMDDDATTVTMHAVVRPNAVQELEATIVRLDQERAHRLVRWNLYRDLGHSLWIGEIDYETYRRLRDEVSKRPIEALPLTFPEEWGRDDS